jgi:2',3'-cyclic-nucleotide 2'-phosphodiesterase/3'-nucleotidase
MARAKNLLRRCTHPCLAAVKMESITRMTPRNSIIVAAYALSLAGVFTPSVRAQDAVQNELKVLRQRIEQQGQKIEMLSAQVARLSAQLDGRTANAPAPAPAPAPAAGPAVTPTPAVADFTPPATPPKPANVHIVVKGDSLDKIAKQHNTTAVDLQKINKITDPKKLQIGQQLLLPPSDQKGQ